MVINWVEVLKIYIEERRDEEGRDEKGGEKDFWRKFLESCVFTFFFFFIKLGRGSLGEFSACFYKE